MGAHTIDRKPWRRIREAKSAGFKSYARQQRKCPTHSSSQSTLSIHSFLAIAQTPRIENHQSNPIRAGLWIPFSRYRSVSRLLRSGLIGKRRRRARALRSRKLVFRGGRRWPGGRLWARRRGRLLRVVGHDEDVGCAKCQRCDSRRAGVVLWERGERMDLLDNDEQDLAVMNAGCSKVGAQGCFDSEPTTTCQGFDDLGHWSTTHVLLCGLHGHACCESFVWR